MKEKHESRQRSPLKYVKLVSSNEGNGKKERVGRREIFVERERKGSDNSKRKPLMGQLHSELFRVLGNIWDHLKL